jgi:hypothetical protein
MQLMHVKLKNHEDVLAYVEECDDETIVLVHPVTIQLDPDKGVYAKHWLVFSENNSVKIPNSEVLFVNKANDSAKKYYEAFTDQRKDSYINEDYEEYDEHELEEMYNSMIESKDAIKH